MTTREHLIYHLQAEYALLRDFLPLLDRLRHDGESRRLLEILQREHDGVRGEMDTLERALHLLSAQISMERNPLAAALRESDERLRHRMNPAREQLEVHAALLVLQVIQTALGLYQAGDALARAIGEHDVALLIEENLTRQTTGLYVLRNYLPTLIAEASRAEARHAA